MGAAKVSGVCRLGADPELKFTPSGAAVCTARAIFQDRYQDRQTGEWKDGDALWVNLVAWRQLGENVAESFRKGDDVIVLDGVLKVREFELRDGGKGYAVDVTVRELGPSVRWHAARSARVDRQGEPSAAVDDPWGEPHDSRNRNQPPPRQPGYEPAAETQREANRWIGSGKPVRPTPQNYGQGSFDNEPPFFHRTPGYQP